MSRMMKANGWTPGRCPWSDERSTSAAHDAVNMLRLYDTRRARLTAFRRSRRMVRLYVCAISPMTRRTSPRPDVSAVRCPRRPSRGSGTALCGTARAPHLTEACHDNQAMPGQRPRQPSDPPPAATPPSHDDPLPGSPISLPSWTRQVEGTEEGERIAKTVGNLMTAPPTALGCRGSTCPMRRRDA